MSSTKKIVIGVLVVVLCALAYYFMVWTKTPIYSLNLVREAVKKHDVVQFRKHVDMDSLYGKAIEDTIIAIDKIEGTNVMSNPFASGIVQILKEPAVNVLKAETLEYIAGDRENNPVSEADQFAEELKEKADTENIEVKDVSVIKEQGNRAEVAIKVYNSRLDKNFIIKVKMSKLVDGYWRIKEFSNLVDFLVEVEAARVEKLAQLNEKIKAEIDDAIYVPEASVALTSDDDAYFPEYKLQYKFTVENTGEKDIAKFYSDVLVLDKNNEVIREINEISYKENILQANTKKGLRFSEKLNQFIPEDSLIINNIDGVAVKVDIYKIVYADGKEVELLTELP